MNLSLISMIFVIVLSIHLLLKQYSCVKKGTQVNYLVMVLSIISLVCAIIAIILK